MHDLDAAPDSNAVGPNEVGDYVTTRRLPQDVLGAFIWIGLLAVLMVLSGS